MTEMEMKHTPGPWKVVDGDSHNGYPHEPSEYEYCVIPVSTAPRPNNIIASFWDCEWGYEAKANANLIATSPALLAVCDKAVAHAELDLENEPPWYREMVHAVMFARGEL